MSSYCGTVVVYGGLQMINCQTISWNHTIVPDPDRTAPLYSKFLITIETYVHDEDIDSLGLNATGPVAKRPYPVNRANEGASANQGIDAGTFNGLITANKHAVLSQHFSQWRKDFAYMVEGDVVLAASGSSMDVNIADVDNGPKVLECSIVHVVGYRAFKIRATFEICKIACELPVVESKSDAELPLIQGRALLTHRWGVVETRDSDMKMTRAVTGYLRVAHTDFWIFLDNAIRMSVLPTLQRGYQRAHVRVSRSSNGLTMQYDVIDRQREAAPPYPAVEWSGTHEEVAAAEKGAGSISVAMVGAPGTQKKHLLLCCIAVVNARLNFQSLMRRVQPTEGSKATAVHISQINVADILHDNVVHMTVAYVRVNPQVDRWLDPFYSALDSLPGVLSLIAGTPDRTGEDKYNRDLWPLPYPYDPDTPDSILTQRILDPCDPNKFQFPTNLERYLSPDQEEDDESSPKKPDKDKGSPGDERHETKGTQEETPYIHVDVESVYYTDWGTTPLPRANEGNPVYTPGNLTSSGTSQNGQGQQLRGLVGVNPRIQGSSSSSRTPTVVIARLHEPIARRVIFIKAERSGKVAKMPPMFREFDDVNGIRHVLSESEIFPGSPKLGADGSTWVYSLEARLVYWMERPVDESEVLSTGRLPWTLIELAQAFYKLEENYDPGMLGIATDSPGDA